MEWGDIILVAVSGSIGVVGTLLGAILNNHFGRGQMKEIWAEEERKRRSDRRRELYERELNIVSDAVDTILLAITEQEWDDQLLELVREVDMTKRRAHLVLSHIKDRELMERYEELMDGFNNWFGSVDSATGMVAAGREEEFEELRRQTEDAASKVRGRITEILVEV